MKLLLCTECYDVFKLDILNMRCCKCGNVKGQYIDEIHAEYFGDCAVPLGFNNMLLANAIKQQPQKGFGKVFEAFVIAKNCPTFVKMN